MTVPEGNVTAQSARMVSQSMEMEFKLPSVFDLQLLNEKGKNLPPETNFRRYEAPVHWFVITGDENVEMIVHVHQEKDSVRAFYINSGTFDASRAVPFPDNQAAFVLNSVPRNSESANFFKAWIGVRTNEKCQMTFEYP